jgi:hypothetical protein
MPRPLCCVFALHSDTPGQPKAVFEFDTSNHDVDLQSVKTLLEKCLVVCGWVGVGVDVGGWVGVYACIPASQGIG